MNKRLDRRTAEGAALRQWLLFLAALAAWALAVGAAALGGYLFCSSRIWQDTPSYRALQFVKAHLGLFVLGSILLGWAALSYFFIARPVRHLQLLLQAAEALARPSEQPILLPQALHDAENQLNLVRTQALQSIQAAREAEQRKNDLVVYLAHDLKTPLTSVIGYLTLLQEEPDLPAAARARYTGIALDKALRLEDLINEFFEITRFNLSHIELERREVDLRLMLEQLCSEAAPLLTERRLQCQLDLPDGLTVLCDPDKMARVFDNLLNNACHYAYPDTLLRITAARQGGCVQLCFCNAGADIPPEKLARMFERFFRLDTARSSRTGNAGLGLAIAKEIVEAHGGSITAQSQDQQIRFTVTLPAR